MFRGHHIPFLDSINMVSLRVTSQRSVANNTARSTDFATSPVRLDISEDMAPPDVCLFAIATDSVDVANGTSFSDAMVPPDDDQ